MMINGNISDLFFNSEHRVRYENGHYADHDNLEEEASDFIQCLNNLGVATPSPDELVADFRNRL